MLRNVTLPREEETRVPLRNTLVRQEMKTYNISNQGGHPVPWTYLNIYA